MALYALLAAPVSMRAQETETIEDGVYIGNIYVGGMTEEEAVSAVEAYVESADSAEMTLKTGDKSVSVTAADLGISFSNLNVVDEAIDVGRSGNLIKAVQGQEGSAAGGQSDCTLTGCGFRCGGIHPFRESGAAEPGGCG